MNARVLLVVLVSGCGGAAPLASPAAVPEPPPAAAPAPAAPAPPPAPEPDTPAQSERCQRDDPFGPVVIDAEAWQGRRFARAGKLSELRTSRQDPAKACGARDSYASIARLTCDDGSQPLADAGAAQRARQGNVGPGGACDNIVDRYLIRCPEGEHEVFVDMYWCPKTQEFF